MTRVDIVQRFQDYLFSELQLANPSVETYSREAALYIRFLEAAGIGLDKVGLKDLSAYVIQRQQGGIDQRTIAKAISALRSLHQYLVLEGVRPDNPALRLELPKMIQKLPNVLS